MPVAPPAARRPRSRRARTAWVAALASIAALGFLVGEARGRIDELLQDAGASMLSYGRRADTDRARVISLNGAELHVVSGHHADTLDTVLDTFESRCALAGGQFAGQLSAATAKSEPLLRSAHLALLDGVLRSDDGQHGYVACFDLGGGRMRPLDLVARLRAFAVSYDVSAIGALRFVWAQRAGRTTSYIAVWTEGRLPLRAMFPERGDAPGRDVPEVPRPRGARRVLSAFQAQREPLLVSYVAAESPARLAAGYREQLLGLGFEVHQVHSDARDTQYFLLRRGTMLTAAIVGATPGGTASISLFALH